MTTHPIFRVGDSWICVECGSGYVLDQVMPERLRTRMRVQHAAQAVLEYCDDGTAAGLHVLIAGVDLNGCLPMNRIVGFNAGGTRSSVKR